MMWHRFLISIPFVLFMFGWFIFLGTLAQDGKIVKRNVFISVGGAILFGIMLVLSGCQSETTPHAKPAVDAGADSGQQAQDDDTLYYEWWMESTMEY